jgi:CheY-like chemotaxis protein
VLVGEGTRAMLEDLGHDVVQAGSGPAALGLLATGEEFDILITDQIMPEMSGFELARLVRDSYPDLPVVLASGYADLSAAVKTELDLPRLAKPFTQRALAEIISRERRHGCGAQTVHSAKATPFRAASASMGGAISTAGKSTSTEARRSSRSGGQS